ncbi:MAG: hypothetical protein ABI548_24970 [Polyangiaceae bacterium]
MLPPSRKLDLSFELTREPWSGAQTLWGNIPSLGIHQVIGRTAAPLVCGVASQPAGTYTRRHSRLTMADCGDETVALAVSIEGDTLTLGTAEIKLPERSFIVHEELAQPLPPERDCSKTGKTLVSVSVSRDAKGVRLTIPALHITRQVAEDRPVYCRTTVLKRAQRMDVSCATVEFYSVSLHLTVQRDVLFVQTRGEEAADDNVSIRQLGYELPCNAEVRFDGFNYRSPSYAPTPDHCANECWISKDGCESHCAEQFSDAQGKPTPAGKACKERCNAQEQTCDKSCRR